MSTRLCALSGNPTPAAREKMRTDEGTSFLDPGLLRVLIHLSAGIKGAECGQNFALSVDSSNHIPSEGQSAVVGESVLAG